MKKIYFVGIGGIGMSALARYYNSKGWKVSGYDKAETNLTKKLVREGMEVFYTEDISSIQKGANWVVYTPAIPDKNKILTWYRTNGYNLKKRAEVLGLISKESFAICIAGTHGKTTTSSYLAHVLSYNKFDYTGFIGGLSVENGSNFIDGGSDWVVLEADEYDRSFLHLEPQMASLMSLDADHLDIYGDEEGMIDGFRAFTYKIRSGGSLFVRRKDVEILGADWRRRVEKQGVNIKIFGAEGDVKLYNLKIEDGKQLFGYSYKNWSNERVEMTMAGQHNVDNAAVAISIALDIGIKEEGVYKAIECFKGVKRRFETIIQNNEVVMIDDYAHHPTELKAVVSAVRSLYPKKRILGVFQPHLYSRTQDFYLDFAKALDLLDETILLDIYPARELPIEGVTSELILNEMKSVHKSILKKEAMKSYLKKRNYDVLLMLGAGDIGTLITDIASEIL